MIQLKELREERGWSQRQTAMKAGLAPTTYHNYEKGIREPDSETLKVLADVFNVTVDRILGRETPKVDYKKRKLDALEYALFGGEEVEITDAMYEEIKQFAQFVQKREKDKKK